jgi:hypothetical protein
VESLSLSRQPSVGIVARSWAPWLLIDEAHHLLLAKRGKLDEIVPDQLRGLIFITVHPDTVAVEVMRTVDTVLALGAKAGEVIQKFWGLRGTEWAFLGPDA